MTWARASNSWRLAIAVTAMIVAASAAHAGGALRCGNKVIMQGDTSEAVRRTCGAPADIVKSSILRRPSYRRHGHVFYYGEQMVDVDVEKWTYNFGPNKLMHRLRFVDGVLEEIEVLGYGYNESKDEP